MPASALRPALLGAALVVGLLAAVPSPAFAAETFPIDVQPESILVEPGASVSLYAYAEEAIAYQWQYRADSEAPWENVSGVIGAQSPTLMLDLFSLRDGEYRVLFTDADGRDHPSDIATVSFASLDWTVAPVFVPEGTVVTQHAEVPGQPSAVISWQVAPSPGGPWTDLPGASGGDLSLTATLALDRQYLRPVATVDDLALEGTYSRLYVYPTVPALPVQEDADAQLASPYGTAASGEVVDDVLTVTLIPGADPFGAQTWYHGTGFSTPTDLGWARVQDGALAFDVSALAPGEHTLLLRLPFPGNGQLVSSGAIRFTVPERVAAPEDDPVVGAAPADDPELVGTGVDPLAGGAAAGALLLAGAALLLRRRAAQR